MSIYIARGDDTLGPYTPDEAAELIKTGKLRSGDWAARNGDGAWVTLSSMLPAPPPPAAPILPPVRPPRRWPYAVILFGIMAGVTGVWPPIKLSTLLPTPSPQQLVPRPPVTASPLPTVAVITPTSTPSPTTPSEKRTRLHGIIRLTSPEGVPLALPEVRVRAYPTQELTPYLEKRKAGLDRLTPLIAAAESEKETRLTAARNARQALLGMDPGSDLEPSLRFNLDQARAAVKNAEDDYRYLLDQHREAQNAEAYFRELPDTAIEASVGPGGEFSIDLPPGESFALAASVQPPTGGARHWLVRISTGGEEQKSVVLSDDNTTSSPSPDSLIVTAD